MSSFGNNIIVNESGTAAHIENYKIVIVGDQQVGKTSILSRYKYETIEDGYAPTVGIDFLTKNVFLEDKTVRLIMWDTAGQERFKSLIPNYLKNAHSIILTYDITSKSSFNSLSIWLKDIKEHIQDNVFIIVAGNKLDLSTRRQVSKAEIEKFCEVNSLAYVETSALSGEGIKRLFDVIAGSFFDNPSEPAKDKTVILDPQAGKEEKKSKSSSCCGGGKSSKKKDKENK